MRKKPLLFSVLTALLFLFTTSSIQAADPKEILAGKQLFSVGVCGFKGQEFKAFAGEILLAPKSAIDRFENCALFVRDRTMDPAWIVLLNDDGQPKEIILWQDPNVFEVIYRKVKGIEI